MSDLYGFELLNEREIPELHSRARLFRYRQTGTELLSLENGDEHKSFGIVFRTPPRDSTGVAHILEHSVLCGSRKYPLKEPFVELLKGSLKTFLNAITFPDKTAYPLASQNTQDFYNLIDVYLDAVFYPRLTEMIFRQEGWHYELDRPNEPMRYKGVVFNEMKGAYASPDRLLSEYSRQSLFPDTCYGHSSGGDPEHITTLTYEQFRQYHQQYYHPSNARVFFYGDDDPEERLRIIHDYLKDFQAIDVGPPLALQSRFSDPIRASHTYVIDPRNRARSRSMISVNWLLDETNDPFTTLALQVMGYILAGMLASPLRKALIESGYGEDLVGGGVSTGMRQAFFSTGLKGIDVANASDIEALVLRSLRDVVEQGIDPLTIEAAVNTFEFRLREQNTGSLPKGLSLMVRSLSTWLHDGDPFVPLAFEEPLTRLKQEVAKNDRFFERLIEQSLLQNEHRSTVTLEPDEKLGKQQEERERKRLDDARAAMSEEEVQSVVEMTREIKAQQEKPDPPEAVAKIPRLTLEDLDRYNRVIPLTVFDLEGNQLSPLFTDNAHLSDPPAILYHDLPTNGVLYLDLGFNMHVLPEYLLPYVPLFGRALREMGTEQEDYTRFAQRIGCKTGGMYAQRISMYVSQMQTTSAWMFLRSKATLEQTNELLAILRDILFTVRLDDQERFHKIVLEAKAREESSFVPNGSGFVNLRLRSRFNEADWANEKMGGADYIFFLRQLVHEVENNWPVVLGHLEEMRQLLFNRHAMICNITIDSSQFERVRPCVSSFLQEIPIRPMEMSTWNPTYRQGHEGLTAPTQVNYVGKAADLYELGYQFHGSVGVIKNYLRNTWLWDKVRVQGGAYGCFCRFGRYSGVLTFISYRDPNLLSTLDVFNRSGDFLRRASLDQSEVVRSIIGRIGEMDTYQFPDAKGYTSMLRYLTGHTDEMRQRKREEILETTVEDFRAFADVLDMVRDSGNVVAIGSWETIDRANAIEGHFLQPTNIL